MGTRQRVYVVQNAHQFSDQYWLISLEQELLFQFHQHEFLPQLVPRVTSNAQQQFHPQSNEEFDL